MNGASMRVFVIPAAAAIMWLWVSRRRKKHVVILCAVTEEAEQVEHYLLHKKYVAPCPEVCGHIVQLRLSPEQGTSSEVSATPTCARSTGRTE